MKKIMCFCINVKGSEGSIVKGEELPIPVETNATRSNRRM
jgi:hypothetical protein